MTSTTSERSRAVKPVTEYGPLVVFFGAYVLSDLITATAALMIATLAALVLSYAVSRRVPLMPLITAGVVGVFGGLTIWLNDETFIKLKPTIVQGLIAAVLLGGLAFGRSLLKPVLGSAWQMNDEGWRRLTFRFGIFFVAMALLNEAVWRTQSTDFWVSFKVFGIMGLTFLFILTQLPMLNRHHAGTPAPGPAKARIDRRGIRAISPLHAAAEPTTGATMFIQTEQTPNPASLKFSPGANDHGQGDGPFRTSRDRRVLASGDAAVRHRGGDGGLFRRRFRQRHQGRRGRVVCAQAVDFSAP